MPIPPDADRSPPQRRMQVDRRTVMRTSAWALPVIAVGATAPAFAASPCTPVTVDFTSFTTGRVLASGSVITTVAGVSVTLTLSGNTSGRSQDGATLNGEIYPTTASTKELRFFDANTSGTSQTIAINFFSTSTGLALPVDDLTLTYIDVDQATNYNDRLIVNTPGFAFARGSAVQGVGTAGSPFRSSTGTSAADGSTTGNVALSWDSVSSASVTYAQATGTVTGYPHIGLRSIAFTPVTC